MIGLIGEMEVQQDEDDAMTGLSRSIQGMEALSAIRPVEAVIDPDTPIFGPSPGQIK